MASGLEIFERDGPELPLTLRIHLSRLLSPADLADCWKKVMDIVLLGDISGKTVF
jgi:hypothetical protein